MRSIWLGVFVFGIFFHSSLHAQLRSPRATHPMTFMHQIPAGDAPGWFGKFWFDIEVSQANIWNTAMNVSNSQNGHQFTYEADFEQTTYSLKNGFQLNPDLAFTIDLPYAVRSGGFLDATIEEVHRRIGTNRFLREEHPQGLTRFRVTEDGKTVLDEGFAAGLSSVVLGFKYWPIKKIGANCPCGIGFGLNFSVPVEAAPKGFYSGGVNSSLSIQAGFPLGKEGALWTSATVSYLPENKYFENWPRNKYIQSYDLHLDIPLGGALGLVLEGRFESPFMNRDQLSYDNAFPTQDEYLLNKVSSGYNALTLWRIYETFGLRYRLGKESFLRLLVLEDGGLGGYDDTGDWMYVNNSPDVMGILQLSVGF